MSGFEMEQGEGRNFIDTRSEQERSPLVNCFWCERLHPGEHPLSVCPACAARLATMRSLEMTGSYPLSGAAIDRALTRTSPGNYALGYMDGDTFKVFYVGRADSDVRQRLHEWVGIPSRYDRFAPASKAPWAIRLGGLMPPGLGAPALGRVGNAESSYTRFAYSYAPTAEAAFEKECRNYDDFGGSGELDNEVPPAWTPRGSGACPAQARAGPSGRTRRRPPVARSFWGEAREGTVRGGSPLTPSSRQLREERRHDRGGEGSATRALRQRQSPPHGRDGTLLSKLRRHRER